jgi:hypothetical protein
VRAVVLRLTFCSASIGTMMQPKRRGILSIGSLIHDYTSRYPETVFTKCIYWNFPPSGADVKQPKQSLLRKSGLHGTGYEERRQRHLLYKDITCSALWITGGWNHEHQSVHSQVLKLSDEYYVVTLHQLVQPKRR